MEVTIRNMENSDWTVASQIYQQGIDDGNATYERKAPEWKVWDAAHIRKCRFVAVTDDKIVGFAVISNISARAVYSGVAEVSIYIAKDCQGKGVGKRLMNHLVAETEKAGFWTLQSVIMQENLPSLKLHEKCGFRTVGFRERMAKDFKGVWRNTVLMERRSSAAGID